MVAFGSQSKNAVDAVDTDALEDNGLPQVDSPNLEPSGFETPTIRQEHLHVSRLDWTRINRDTELRL